jgi:RNA-binding protein 8A
MNQQHSGKSHHSSNSNRILVGNLPMEITEAVLYDLISKVGEVRQIELPTNPKTGKVLGFALVELANAEQADSAIRVVDGITFQQRRLSVEFAPQPKSSKCFFGLFRLFKTT